MVRSFFSEAYRCLDWGGSLLVVTTKSKLRGFYSENKDIRPGEPSIPDDSKDWWQREVSREQQTSVVVRVTGNEKCKLKPQRKLRPHRNIEPHTNYPFRFFARKSLNVDDVNIPEKFHDRKTVYIHQATK